MLQMVTFITFECSWTYTLKYSLQLNRSRKKTITIRGFLQNASLFCPLSRNRTFNSQVVRSQGKGALVAVVFYCVVFVCFHSSRSDILNWKRLVIVGSHCNWRQPKPFPWNTVPMKPYHRLQKYSLFGKVWR